MKWLNNLINKILFKHSFIERRNYTNFWQIETKDYNLTDIIIGYQRLIIIDLIKYNDKAIIFNKIVSRLLLIEDFYQICWFETEQMMINELDWYLALSSDNFIVLIG